MAKRIKEKVDLNKVFIWMKATIKNSFQKALENFLAIFFTMLIITFFIFIYAFWKEFVEVMTLLLYEVAVLWLVIIVILSSIVIIIILHRTALPKPVEELIIIEKGREPSIHGSSHAYDFPCLRFILRVINYTYYSFVPKKVEIKYYCGGKKVGQNIGSASSLPKCGDGSIECKILVEKKYSDFNDWKIESSVIYARGKKEYVIKKDVKFPLSESLVDKLKRRVDVALAKQDTK